MRAAKVVGGSSRLLRGSNHQLVLHPKNIGNTIGSYAGKILVVNERSDRPIRYVKFLATFQDDNKLLPYYVDVGECVFPEAGLYSFEIYFSTRDGGEALAA